MGVSGVNVNILLYQIPGGMYSNLQSQLKEGGCPQPNSTKCSRKCRASVRKWATRRSSPDQPDSRHAGRDERHLRQALEDDPHEVRQYFRGYYGKTPAPVDPEIQKIVLGDEQPITCRPGEKIPPEIEQAKKEIGVWCTQPEDVLSYILFPQVAKDFLPAKFAKGKLRRPRQRAAGIARSLRNITKTTTLPQKIRRRKASYFLSELPGRQPFINSADTSSYSASVSVFSHSPFCVSVNPARSIVSWSGLDI